MTKKIGEFCATQEENMESEQEPFVLVTGMSELLGRKFIDLEGMF